MSAPSSVSLLSAPESAATHSGLSISTDWLNATVVRITVAGEVDASNAAELAHYVLRYAANSRRLILDMAEVDFFGTAGFSTLMSVNERCVRAAVIWTLAPSRAVSRVIEICDPRRTLPVATS